MADLRGYVTAAGQQFESLAKQMKWPVEIGMIDIGDGMLPDSESPIARTQLVNKIWSFPAVVEQDAKNPGQWVAWIHIPPDHAINGQGYFIREIGCRLINKGDGILYAYRRVSNDWKPVDTSGEAKSFIYKLRFIPGNGELLKPTIDPSVVLVDREDLESEIKRHKESRDHPDATELAKGFTQYATLQKALAGEEDNLALTPKVMKAVLSALGLTKYGAPMIGVPIDWPLAQMPQDIWPDCGMVFLSCAGQGFNKTTYPFAAQLYPSGVMPELRAEFIRGWDNGRGVDPGRQLLSYQAATQLPSIYTYAASATSGVLVTPPINSYQGAYPIDKQATDYETTTVGSGQYFTTSQQLTPNGSSGLATFRVRSRSAAFHKIMRVG